MDEPLIHAPGPAEEEGVVAVITLAFAADPMARWSWPDPAKYLEVMPQIVRAFGGNAFAHSTADCLDGCVGAATWLPPGVEADTERLRSLLEESAPSALLPDLTKIFELMDGYHPSEPHWYLPLIGVDPAHHGKGLGSALMRHALRRCDADRLPAYLESSNPKNIPLYQRHGFEIIGQIQVGSSPTLVPMLRKPR
jgi:hypothetical protein